MSKPVLVHYMNIGNLDSRDVKDYINSVKESCVYDDEYFAVFIPVRNQDTRIECLNPYILNASKEKDKLINKINKLKFDMNELIRKAPYMSKNMLLTERI